MGSISVKETLLVLVFSAVAVANGDPSVWVDDNYCATCNNGGLVWKETAFDTISEAIMAIDEGGVVNVHPGSYAENIFIDGKRLKLASLEGREATIIDGNDFTSPIRIENLESGAVEIEGFTITNSGENWAGIQTREVSSLIVKNCLIIDNKGEGIKTWMTSVEIKDCEIYGRPEFPYTASAIKLDESAADITGCMLQAGDQNGNIDAIEISDWRGDDPERFYIDSNRIFGRIAGTINSPSGPEENVISNNIIISVNGFSSGMNLNIGDFAYILNNVIVGGGGIFLQRGGENTYIANNIIAECNKGVEVWSDSLGVFVNNNIWNNKGNSQIVVDRIGLDGNISEDPKFKDREALDFRIDLTSPCVDAGHTIEEAHLDAFGKTRGVNVSGSPTVSYDIGIYEFDPLSHFNICGEPKGVNVQFSVSWPAGTSSPDFSDTCRSSRSPRWERPSTSAR